MNHSAMDHSAMDHSNMDHSTMDHSQHGSKEILLFYSFSQWLLLAGHSMDHHDHNLMQGNTDVPMVDHSAHAHGSMEHMMSMAVSIYNNLVTVSKWHWFFSSISDTQK